MQILNAMIQAGGYEQAKPHMEVLAEEMVDWLEFLESIDPELSALSGDFGQDYGLAINSKEALIRAATRAEDQEFVDRLEEMFKPYPTPQQQQPQRVPN